MNERVVGWVNWQMDNGWHGWIDEWVDEQMNGWVNGMDEWVGGWADG